MLITRNDNAVLFWNEVFLEAARVDSLQPPNLQEQGGPTHTSRAGAIVHAAMHNAINGVRQRFAFYQDPQTQRPDRPGPPPVGASLEGAGAGAAHAALSALYPGQVALFNSELATFRGLPALQLAGANHQPSIDFGANVAGQLLNARDDDGSQILDLPFNIPPAVGVWQPDPILAPPDPPLGVNWGEVRPFLIDYTSVPTPAFPGPFPPPAPTPRPRYFPDAPPALDSGDYGFAFRMVKAKGRDVSPPPEPPEGRTNDETNIASFWSYDDARGTPIRLYNQHAFQILDQEPNPPAVDSPIHRHARMFALINLAMADAGIVCWDAKYYYNLWRPFQGIRLFDGADIRLRDAAGNDIVDDGNPRTEDDADWLPLGRPNATGPNGPILNTSPNFPAYVSGHSSFGAAMFGMLRKFYDSNEARPFPFTIESDETPNDPRRFVDKRDMNSPNDVTDSWTQAINENSESRIFLGVHWWRDHTNGTPLGQQVADDIWPTFLRPI